MTAVALLCLSAGLLLTVTFGPSLLCLKYPHNYGPWHGVSLSIEAKSCNRCLKQEHRRSPYWQRITSPPAPSTSLIAMTANERFPLRERGTAQIPRLTNGALSLTPAPPVIEGGRHAVLDHEW